MMSAGAVALAGTMPAIGEKNMASRKRTPTVIADHAGAPALRRRPAPDSM